MADKRLIDDVPDKIKRCRNQDMLKAQEQLAIAVNMLLIGQTVEVLVEGYSKAAIKAQEAEQTRGEEVSWRRSDQLVGRTRHDRIVVFTGEDHHIGQIRSLKITGATALTLHGTIIEHTVNRSDGLKTISTTSLPVLG